jgi:hypothetical protein
VGNHGARQLSPLLPRRPIRPDRDGGFQLNLGGDDRERLRRLAPEFSALLDEPEHPALRRLFPPAYAQPSDVEHEEEYRRLMLEDLVARHREELDVLAATATKDHLTEEELLVWSRALNSVRLVLGTVLDVSEADEGRAPETYEEALYHWLTYLLGETIEALAGE